MGYPCVKKGSTMLLWSVKVYKGGRWTLDILYIWPTNTRYKIRDTGKWPLQNFVRNIYWYLISSVQGSGYDKGLHVKKRTVLILSVQSHKTKTTYGCCSDHFLPPYHPSTTGLLENLLGTMYLSCIFYRNSNPLFVLDVRNNAV